MYVSEIGRCNGPQGAYHVAAPIAQVDRAADSYPAGRQFESGWAHILRDCAGWRNSLYLTLIRIRLLSTWE
jgi:hypothetical protein